jgi:hypothetical protein
MAVAPVLGSIGNQTVDEDSTLVFRALATDTDPDSTLSYSLEGSFPQSLPVSTQPTESSFGLPLRTPAQLLTTLRFG